MKCAKTNAIKIQEQRKKNIRQPVPVCGSHALHRQKKINKNAIVLHLLHKCASVPNPASVAKRTFRPRATTGTAAGTIATATENESHHPTIVPQLPPIQFTNQIN